MLSDAKKIGVGLTGCGVLFLTLGVLLFLDRGLMALGNVLFLTGMVTLIGLRRVLQFFFGSRRQILGSIPFFLGVSLVLLGWTLIGFVVEVYGLWCLFKEFVPKIVWFLESIPFVAPVVRALNLPGLIAKMSGRPRGRDV